MILTNRGDSCIMFNQIIHNLDLSKGVWFPLAVSAISLLYALLMPKRISWREFYITFGVVTGLAWMIDLFMGGIFDIYDMGTTEGVGLGDIVSIGIVPAVSAIIFLNYYKSDKKWVYAILFTALAFAFQLGLIQSGFMKFKKWPSWLSIPVFIYMFGFYLPWHIRFINGKDKQSEVKEYNDPNLRFKVNGKSKIR